MIIGDLIIEGEHGFGTECGHVVIDCSDDARRCSCGQIVQDTARYLGIGIVSLVHTIDPHGVLLGGAMTFGVSRGSLGGSFLNWVRSEFRRRTFPLLAKRTIIDFATLGNDAGFLGAAGIARLEHQGKR